jgi:hypothetical protein
LVRRILARVRWLLAAIVTGLVGAATAGVVVADGSTAAARPTRSARLATADNKAGTVISQGTGVCSGKGSQVVAQVNLNPPTSASTARGIAEFANKYSRACVALLARGLNANTKRNAYAVWLYNAPTHAQLLGFVNPAVGHNGRARTEGFLPPHWRHFHQLVISLETSADPGRPHHIVLVGRLPKDRADG